MENEFLDLSTRKKEILKAVIEAHIAGGEPVGSKALVQSKQLPLSSATIRNEMAELEEMGYLAQPHTSAGRIPTERGYRFYVNQLLDSYEMSSNELQELQELTRIKKAELDSILESAGHLMGALTNYTALTFRNKPDSPVIVRFKIVKMNTRRFLIIMVTSGDEVKTEYINTAFELTDDDLSSLEDVLNRFMVNTKMDEVTLPLIMKMEDEFGVTGSTLLNMTVKVIYDTMQHLEGGELRFEGVNRLLQYPEFSDIDRLRGLLGAIEKKDDILRIVSNPKNDDVNIYIGSENTVDIMQNSTLIFRPITDGGRVVGAIGVLGPCRMDYSKVISTVDYLSKHIADMITGQPELPGADDKKTD